MARSLQFGWRSHALAGMAMCAVSLIAVTTSAQDPTLNTGVEQERVLAAEPQTLEERFEAALLMVRLARPELARRYVSEILQMDPSDQQLLDLRNKYGTATFLKLNNVNGLQPESTQLIDRLTKAVQTKTQDPAYVAGLLPKLEGSAREREEALIELRALGAYAVPQILVAINEGTVSRDVLVFHLARMGEDVLPPLIGALESPAGQVQSAACEVLGLLGSRSDEVWLFRAAFSDASEPGVKDIARQAIARLRYEEARHASRVHGSGSSAKLLATAIEHLAGRYEWPTRYEDLPTIPVWTWDAARGTVSETKSSRRNASIYFAERLARDAAEIAPTNEDAIVVALTAMLAHDMESAGWDQPLPTGPGTAHDLAVKAGEETCERILALSIDHQIAASALGAVQALRLNGQRGSLVYTNRKPVIVEALDFPNPRVQFAAAVTILEWDPNRPFRGSRRVVEILARAVQSDEKPDSIVMDPNVQRATMTASLFGELGYDSSIAMTGREGFQYAAGRGDVELAVLHPNVDQWTLTQTIENLRADVRTQNLPLIIFGPGTVRRRFQNLQNQFSNVVFVSETVSSVAIHRELRTALAQLSPPPLTRDQRSQQIQAAAYWLRWIAASAESGVFDLSPHLDALLAATSNMEIVDNALIALGGIATPDVQRRFLGIVESPNYDPQVRTRAALQLGFHIQRHGNLLTPAELDRAVAVSTGEADPAVRSAMSSVIGSLNPNPAAVRKLILDTAGPQPPIPVDQGQASDGPNEI